MRAPPIVALTTLSLALCSAFAGSARADETARPQGKTITIELKIKARRTSPNAAVDVARLIPRAPLPELRQPLLDRIGAAAEKDPF